MQAYQVLEKAIPRGESDTVGRKLFVGGSLVRKWRRQPTSDSSPTTTGQRSILDRYCDLLDAVFIINPQGAGLIAYHVQAHYNRLLRTHAQPIPCRDTQAAAGANLLTKATEAINTLHVEGCTDETLRDLVALRDAADEVINQVEKTQSMEDQPK